MTEAQTRGELLQERVQAVANDAIERASGCKRVPAKALAGESRELGTSPDAAFISKALGKRLEPWAEELREESFGNPRAPFPEDPTAAAEWIEMQSKTDREQWQRRRRIYGRCYGRCSRGNGKTGWSHRVDGTYRAAALGVHSAARGILADGESLPRHGRIASRAAAGRTTSGGAAATTASGVAAATIRSSPAKTTTRSTLAPEPT